MYLNQELNKNKRNKYTEVNSFTSFLCSIYFFLSFYENYFNQLFGSMTKYLLLVIIGLVLLNNKGINLKWQHAVMYLWFLIQIASFFWTKNDTVMKQHFISQVGMLMFYLVMTSVRFDEKFITSILKTILYSSSSMGILALFFSEPYHGVVKTRQVLVLFGIGTDPNNMAVFYLFAISISLWLIIYEKKNIWINSLIFLINTFALGLTGSRGGIITFLAIILCFMILTDTSREKLKNVLFKILLFAFIIMVIYWGFFLILPEEIFERILTFDSYDSGSNRDILWRNTWSLFTEYPFFGAGWGSYYGYNGFFNAVHNTYLAMLSDVGVIGFLLFFSPVLWTLKEAIIRKVPLAIIILVTGLIPSLFIDAINKRFFWNSIIIAFVLVTGQFNEKEYSR